MCVPHACDPVGDGPIGSPRWRSSCLAHAVLLRSHLVAPVLCAALLFAPSLHAQEKDSDLERARALFDQAGELERQGQWPAAQDRLREALRIRETPNLRYALAWALENNDKLIEARTEYEVALRLAQQAGNDEVTRLAMTRIAEVDRKTPLLQVRIKGLIARDTRVLVDGRDVAIRGDAGTLPVDPGARVVRVERAGRPATQQTVSVPPGVLRVVEVKGDESMAVLDDGAAPREGAKASGTVLPWALVGGGGALLLGGVILMASSTSDVSARDDNMTKWCDATACANGTTATRPETTEAASFRTASYDAASRGNTKQLVGGILGGVGMVSIGVGVYMLLRNAAQETPAKAARTSSLRLEAAPLAGGGIAGASFAF